MKRLFIALLVTFLVLAPITCFAVDSNMSTESSTNDSAATETADDFGEFKGGAITLTPKPIDKDSIKHSAPTWWSVTRTLLKGVYTMVAIFGITLISALPLGLIITLGSASKIKPLAYLIRGFVWIIRGTPLLLQILIFVNGPGFVFGVRFYEDTVGVLIAFILNYACYFSEIYRGGIESIPKGQYEAGYVLGMTKTQIFFKVVLLQVIKRIIPPMGNEIITLVKDTSLVRIVGELVFFGTRHKEILGLAEEYIAVKALIWPLFYSGVFYLIFCGVLTLLFGYIEKKLDYCKG